MAVVIEEPSFWDSATTIKVVLVPPNGPDSTFPRENVDLLSYGVAFSGDNSADWPPQVVPWNLIEAVIKAS